MGFLRAMADHCLVVEGDGGPGSRHVGCNAGAHQLSSVGRLRAMDPCNALEGAARQCQPCPRAPWCALVVRYCLEFAAIAVLGVSQRRPSIDVNLKTYDHCFMKIRWDVAVFLDAPDWGGGVVFDGNVRLPHCGLLGGQKSAVICFFAAEKVRAWTMLHGQQGHSKDGSQRLQKRDIGQ